MEDRNEKQYVSRAGVKLEHALGAFALDVTDLVCADLGCHVGGFSDCLLQHGARSVHAVDTGYGILDWKLRSDARVVVLERTNALHLREKLKDARFDLVVIDLGWTPQRLAIPAALAVLKPGGKIISLLKPHYELTEHEKAELMRAGVLSEVDAERTLDRITNEMPDFGATVKQAARSPIRGGKSSRKSGSAGNVEYLLLLSPIGR